jgi:superfamily I DNA/RNA helicase
MDVSSMEIPPLTKEQGAIVDACPLPPADSKQPGQLTRITAAAGTGKTTTLLALADRAAELGHSHITYVTFTNAAALYGKKRLAAALQRGRPLPTIEASTLHSCAHRLLHRHLGESITEEQAQSNLQKFWSEEQIKTWITKTCTKEITSFVKPCYAEIAKRSRSNSQLNKKHQQQLAREQVVHFIYKSLIYFCQSGWTFDNYKYGSFFNRDYYPVKLFHEPNGKGPDYGFLPQKYNTPDSRRFYADQVCQLWSMIVSENIRGFDFEMKRVQLLGLRVPGTLILVDESQDMDACQVDWIARQQVETHGSCVTVVGDPAQAIYGFRGAKPQYLMNLDCTHHYMLTESWRFGPAISNIANLVLYGKHQSKQTGDAKKSWDPYRTRAGLPDKEGFVTTQPIVHDWKKFKVTLIARTNATLFLEILSVLGFSLKAKKDGEDESENGKSSAVPIALSDSDDESIDNNGKKSPTSAISGPSVGLEIPKIHIFGRGEGSGLKLWKSTFKLVESVYDLYRSQAMGFNVGKTLDNKLFPDFVGRAVTWSSLLDECIQKDLSKYKNAIHVVSLCKHQTPPAMKAFKDHVMNKTVSPEQADIILTTCHSAKGMEWDNVQVCEDFVELCCFAKKVGSSAPLSQCQEEPSPKNRRLSDSWQFGFESWGDDLNLAYVACTRAKRTLSIPPCFHKLLETFDYVHEWKSGENKKGAVNTVAMSIPGCGKKTMTEDDAHCFYDSLILPLREEYGMKSDQLLKDTLINFDRDDDYHS